MKIGYVLFLRNLQTSYDCAEICEEKSPKTTKESRFFEKINREMNKKWGRNESFSS